jgi:hypothetical protein
MERLRMYDLEGNALVASQPVVVASYAPRQYFNAVGKALGGAVPVWEREENGRFVPYKVHAIYDREMVFLGERQADGFIDKLAELQKDGYVGAYAAQTLDYLLSGEWNAPMRTARLPAGGDAPSSPASSRSAAYTLDER